MRLRRRTMPDTDLTSLIDVLFILILFFVISAAMIPGQVAVDLPEGAGARPEAKSVVITVQRDGRLSWEGQIMTRDDVYRKAAALPDDSGELLVAADEQLSYGLVASVLEGLRAAGVRSVSLALKGTAQR